MAKVAAPYARATATGCEGSGYLSGIRDGAFVSVADATGHKVGASTFTASRLQPDGSCNLWAYPNVVLGSDFYDVSVAGEDPVTVTATEAQHEGVGIGFGF